jgi:hypothetical protein
VLGKKSQGNDARPNKKKTHQAPPGSYLLRFFANFPTSHCHHLNRLHIFLLAGQ